MLAPNPELWVHEVILHNEEDLERLKDVLLKLGWNVEIHRSEKVVLNETVYTFVAGRDISVLLCLLGFATIAKEEGLRKRY